MHLIPTHEEVVDMVHQTGALRHGHFAFPSGLHSADYLQVALAMRYFQHAKTLSVALSRRIRADSELRAMIPSLSIVAPATGGLPVAYGMCEALRANQVYWAEREEPNTPLRFRQFMHQEQGEKVLLVDDILRTGRKLRELRKLVESNGAEVVGLAVMIYQPNPFTDVSFGQTPLYYLTKLESTYYKDAASCELCKNGVPVERVWI